jgi:Fe-S-cluster-containing dehydrogenase component
MRLTNNRKIIIQSELCRDCQACTLACSLYHEGECNPSLARVMIIKDMARYAFQILLCQHCESPECIVACPTEAMVSDERGVVTIVDEACIRCDACASSCPHNAIFYNDVLDRYIKCDFCVGRQEGPLCVEVCPVGALTLVEAEPVRGEV